MRHWLCLALAFSLVLFSATYAIAQNLESHDANLADAASGGELFPPTYQISWFPLLGSGAPSGACGQTQIYQDWANGQLYSCKVVGGVGSWQLVGGGGSPGGSAGGDLSGTYPNPSVANVQGVSYTGCASPSTNTVPVVTGANAVTCETVPNNAITNPNVTVAGHLISLGGSQALTNSDVGLGNVTNNVQTQAAVVPNTVPSAGQLHVGNAGGTAFATVSLSGDATLASTGALTVANAAITNSKLANMAANTVKANTTASSAAPTDVTVPSCTDTGGNHLNYTNGTGFSCGTSGGGVTFPLQGPSGSSGTICTGGNPDYSFSSSTGSGLTWAPSGFNGSHALVVCENGAFVAMAEGGDWWATSVRGTTTGSTASQLDLQGTWIWDNGGSSNDFWPATDRSGNIGQSNHRVQNLFLGRGLLESSIITITTNTSASTGNREFTVLCDTTSGAVTFTLQAAPTTGQLLFVKKIDSTSNVCTIAGNGINIDNLGNYALTVQNQVVLLHFDGTQWRILSTGTFPHGSGKYSSSGDETASIADTTLVATSTAPGAGEYSYRIYAMSNGTCATPGIAGVTVGAKWTDVTGTQKSVSSIPLDVNGSTTLSGSVTLGDTTSWGTGFLNIFANASTSVIFNTTLTGCTVGTAKYRIYVAVSQVQ